MKTNKYYIKIIKELSEEIENTTDNFKKIHLGINKSYFEAILKVRIERGLK